MSLPPRFVFLKRPNPENRREIEHVELILQIDIVGKGKVFYPCQGYKRNPLHLDELVFISRNSTSFFTACPIYESSRRGPNVKMGEEYGILERM